MNSAARAAIACAALSFVFHSTAHVAHAQNTTTTAGDEKQIEAGKKLYASSCVFAMERTGTALGQDRAFARSIYPPNKSQE